MTRTRREWRHQKAEICVLSTGSTSRLVYRSLFFSSIFFSTPTLFPPASRIPCRDHPRRPVPMVWSDHAFYLCSVIATAMVSFTATTTLEGIGRFIHLSATSSFPPVILPYPFFLSSVHRFPSLLSSISIFLLILLPSIVGRTTLAYRRKAGVTPA